MSILNSVNSLVHVADLLTALRIKLKMQTTIIMEIITDLNMSWKLKNTSKSFYISQIILIWARTAFIQKVSKKYNYIRSNMAYSMPKPQM